MFAARLKCNALDDNAKRLLNDADAKRTTPAVLEL